MAPSWTRAVVVLAALGTAQTQTSPSTFLASPSPDVDTSQFITFLDELKESLGVQRREATGPRLDAIARALNLSFVSLPKTADGTLSAAGARYAVHRYLTQHHGWQVKGLAPAGASWATSSQALGLGQHVPGHVRDVLEERVGRHGFDLHRLAVLVSTVENLIHAEALGQLEATFSVLEQDTKRPIGQEIATEVVSTYLAAYILGFNVSELSRPQVETMNTYISSDFPYWNETRNLLLEVQQEVVGGAPTLAFSDVARMAEILTERLGQHIDLGDCQDIRSRLLKHEDGSGTGRVRLRDFYASTVLDGNWQFTERVEYLRLMGVLDESNASDPRVLIPNYLYSHANCLNVSRFYNLCCMNKCDGLLARIERRVRAPHATPAEIIRIVEATPSEFVPANRTLPQALRRKLQEVAEHHHGWVPLHGRLFSQWMHFAYPRECPYPHVSGTTALLTESEWQMQTGTVTYLSDTELRRYVDSARSRPRSDPGSAEEPEEEVGGSLCSAMWTHEEELVDAHNWSPAAVPGHHRGAPRSAVLRPLVLAVLLASFAVTLWRLVWQGAVSFVGVGLKSMAASAAVADAPARERAVVAV